MMGLQELVSDQVRLQIASVGLLVSAMLPIYFGSYGSLSLMQNPTHQAQRTSYSPLEKEKAILLSTKNALMIPILGSASVYLFFHLLNTAHGHLDRINTTITYGTYALFCIVFLHSALEISRRWLPRSVSVKMETHSIVLNEHDRRICSVHVSLIHAMILMTAIILSVIYAHTNNWFIGNVFASCLAMSIIAAVSVQSFGTGFILLVGMLIYDIVWGLKTDYLMCVSDVLDNSLTSISWPRSINHYFYDNITKPSTYFTMFGLGDIIIPGIFIAYCLRYDRLQAWKQSALPDFSSHDFIKPYFNGAMLAYSIGAGLSIYSVHVWKDPQSAMLFITPLLIINTIITAMSKGELRRFRDLSGLLSTPDVYPEYVDEYYIEEEDEDYVPEEVEEVEDDDDELDELDEDEEVEVEVEEQPKHHHHHYRHHHKDKHKENTPQPEEGEIDFKEDRSKEDGSKEDGSKEDGSKDGSKEDGSKDGSKEDGSKDGPKDGCKEDGELQDDHTSNNHNE